ncbi:MAG: glycosyltransferase family 2 protein [Campylobacterota bacterium]|nr:glycosyltransferase family 2 protein [Campylobacterota bacterium]
MNKYKLSIIIPHYNSSKLLEKLLSTIPQYKDIQRIVVDDKSKIEDIEYIKTLHSKYDFELYINDTEKKGAGVARNIALEKVKGKWILFADSDDYFTDNFYESVSKYFDSDNDVVFFKATSIYIDTKEEADRHLNFVNILDSYIRNSGIKEELSLRYNLPGPISKMVKTKFIQKNKIKFDEIIASNDVMVSIKVGYYMNRFTVCNKIIYIITKNKGSLTTNTSEKIFDIRFNTIINMIKFLRNKLTKEELKLLNISRYGRNILIKSVRYGIFKFIKTLFLLFKNRIGFFHYKLLNPFHIFIKTKRLFEKNKIELKYQIDE